MGVGWVERRNQGRRAVKMPEQTRTKTPPKGEMGHTQSPFKTKESPPSQRRVRGGTTQGATGISRPKAKAISATASGSATFSRPGGVDPEVLRGLQWLAEVLFYRTVETLGVTAPGEEPQEMGAAPKALSLMLRDLATELSQRTKIPPSEGNTPPSLPEGGLLPRFRAIFDLDSLEGLLILGAVAPAFDGRFSAAFGGLFGRPNVDRASADLLGQVLGMDSADRARLSGCLRPGRPLERFALLNLDYGDAPGVPLNRQALDVPARVLWYLLDGSTVPPGELQGALSLRAPRWTLDDAPFEASVRRSLKACLAQLDGPAPLPLVVVEGPPGAGQRETAECLAAAKGVQVLEAHISKLLLSPNAPRLGPILMREALLQGALIYLVLASGDVLDDKGDAIVTDEQYRQVLHFLDVELGSFPLPTVVTGDYASMAVLAGGEREALFVTLRLPERRVQRLALERSLKRMGVSLEGEIITDVLSRYHLDHMTTEDVVRAARAVIRGGDQRAESISPGEMERALEIVLSRNLGTLSERLNAAAQWDDLVLPEDLMIQLRAMRFLVEHRYRIYEDWGLKRVGQGRGVKALFSGPSGTGKTLAAEVMASDIRVPLYKVDLSQLVSKWVGETEKNIDKIFRDAQASQAMLLFDEADSLFGSRGAVEGGNDRWANFQINYLLQRFEVHDGVVILTSNMPNAIDTAFARRMHFLIEFRLPDEDMRKVLWEKAFVGGMPLGDDLDIPFLAERFEISASNIKNVVMMGAFLAAADGDILNMRQVARGMQVEFQKLGKACTRTDFGPYYKHLDINAL